MKRILSILLIFSIILSICGCSSTKNINEKEKKEYKLRQSFYTDTFDTFCAFYAFTNTEEEFNTLSNEIHNMLIEYHKFFDIYNEYDGISNIRTINNNAGISPVKVDKKIIDLLKYCQSMTKKTNNYVDCTYGRVMSIWHQYIDLATQEEDPIISVPNNNDIQKALQKHGWDTVQIDEKNSTVYITDSMVSLNVGSIAKGYAAQRIADYLKEKNLKYTAINLGGNVTTIDGKGSNKDFWKVGVVNPEKYEEEEYLLTLNIKAKSVATSGDYERFYIADDNRYCHIIDLKTGFPANSIRAVTVITDDAGYADALSTALFIMPINEGKKYVESLNNVEAIWILKDGKTIQSSSFENYIAE